MNQNHIRLLYNPLSNDTKDKINKIHPYIKEIAFKLREWNGLVPFKSLSIDIPEISIKNNFLLFTLKVTSKEKLVKYDRDFRKAFFNIIIKNGTDVIFTTSKFGKKSGVSNFKIYLNSLLNFSGDNSLILRIEYGLLSIEKMINK